MNLLSHKPLTESEPPATSTYLFTLIMNFVSSACFNMVIYTSPSVCRGGLAMVALGNARWAGRVEVIKRVLCGKQAIFGFCQGWAGRVEVRLGR